MFGSGTSAVAVMYVNGTHSQTTDIHIVVKTGFIMMLSSVQYGVFRSRMRTIDAHNSNGTCATTANKTMPYYIYIYRNTHFSLIKKCALS